MPLRDSILIERRFCGPPASGNGGYAAGHLAAALGEGIEDAVRTRIAPSSRTREPTPRSCSSRPRASRSWVVHPDHSCPTVSGTASCREQPQRKSRRTQRAVRARPRPHSRPQVLVSAVAAARLRGWCALRLRRRLFSRFLAAAAGSAGLVDVELPDGDEVTLARELAALPWRPRVVLTSVNGTAPPPRRPRAPAPTRSSSRPSSLTHHSRDCSAANRPGNPLRAIRFPACQVRCAW